MHAEQGDRSWRRRGGDERRPELSERGFEVVVLERRSIAGGKARSIPVIDDGSGTSGHQRADTGVTSVQHRLPGEHGFRFFPGFYKHVIDTMRRIPSFDGRQVADHLVPTTRVGFTQYGKPTFLIPSVFPQRPNDAGTMRRCAHEVRICQKRAPKSARSSGVRSMVGPKVRRTSRSSRTMVRGDHYLAAMPIERIVPLVNARMLIADPKLANLRALAANVDERRAVLSSS
jgi:uncharacterized protein with NAD-binding domain and iron-sulfur cluster